MKELKSKEEIDKAINSENLSIIKFSAEWCGPCKVIATTITEIEPQFPNVNFYEINIEEIESEILDQYKVRNIPLILFFKEGLITDRIIGSYPKEDLIKKINENLKK